MHSTQVKELMTKHPVLINPDTTLKEAAEFMRDIDCGVLPIGNENKLEGMLTDRDIVVRAVAKGKEPDEEKVSDYMTKNVYYCGEDDTLEQAADKMREHNVSRLIVRDESGKTCGILTFGCILRNNKNTEETNNVVEHAIRRKAA